MRGITSLGVLTSVAWLTSAAVLPRYGSASDSDGTCVSGDASTVFVTVLEPNTLPPSTVHDTQTIVVVSPVAATTVTVTPVVGGPGPLSISGTLATNGPAPAAGSDTSCTSSLTGSSGQSVPGNSGPAPFSLPGTSPATGVTATVVGSSVEAEGTTTIHSTKLVTVIVPATTVTAPGGTGDADGQSTPTTSCESSLVGQSFPAGQGSSSPTQPGGPEQPGPGGPSPASAPSNGPQVTPCSPVTMTYTLPSWGSSSDGFTGVITIIPESCQSPNLTPQSPGSQAAPTGPQPSDNAPGANAGSSTTSCSSSVASFGSALVVTITQPAGAVSSAGITGVTTITANPNESTLSGDTYSSAPVTSYGPPTQGSGNQPGSLTVTVPNPIPQGTIAPGQGGQEPSGLSVSVVTVTYTTSLGPDSTSCTTMTITYTVPGAESQQPSSSPGSGPGELSVLPGRPSSEPSLSSPTNSGQTGESSIVTTVLPTGGNSQPETSSPSSPSALPAYGTSASDGNLSAGTNPSTGAGAGAEPITFTVSPGGSRASPFVITYTPGATTSQSAAISAYGSFNPGLTSSPGSSPSPASVLGSGPLTITIPGGEPSASTLAPVTPNLSHVTTSTVPGYGAIPDQTTPPRGSNPTIGSGAGFNPSASSAAWSSPLPGPLTLTITPDSQPVTTIVVTYTPNGAGSQTSPTFSAYGGSASGANPSNGAVSTTAPETEAGIIIVTLTPDNPSVSPFVVTYTPSVSDTPVGQPSDITSGGQSTNSISLAGSYGSQPQTVSSPTRSGSDISSNPETVITLALPSGSTTVITLHGSKDSATLPTTAPGNSITGAGSSTPAKSDATYTISAYSPSSISEIVENSVVTITESTSPVGGNSPSTVVVSPITLSITLPGSAGSAPTVLVLPTQTTLTQPHSSNTIIESATSPLVFTQTALSYGDGSSEPSATGGPNPQGMSTVTAQSSIALSAPSFITVTISSASSHPTSLQTSTSCTSSSVQGQPEPESISGTQFPGGQGGGSGTASPSDITLWPPRSSVSTSCTSTNGASSAHQTGGQSPVNPSGTTVGPFTMSANPASSSSSTCTTLTTSYVSQGSPAPAGLSQSGEPSSSSCSTTSSNLPSNNDPSTGNPTAESFTSQSGQSSQLPETSSTSSSSMGGYAFPSPILSSGGGSTNPTTGTVPGYGSALPASSASPFLSLSTTYSQPSQSGFATTSSSPEAVSQSGSEPTSTNQSQPPFSLSFNPSGQSSFGASSSNVSTPSHSSTEGPEPLTVPPQSSSSPASSPSTLTGLTSTEFPIPSLTSSVANQTESTTSMSTMTGPLPPVTLSSRSTSSSNATSTMSSSLNLSGSPSPSAEPSFTASVSSGNNTSSFLPTQSSSAPASSGTLSTSLNATATAGAPLTSASCGGVGDNGAFALNFDDIASASVSAQPLVGPYHRFWFSSGFSVVPPPSASYAPSSGSQMTYFNPANASNGTVAQIGVGLQSVNSCFRFDFQGISVGCNSTVSPCAFNVTGLQWNGTDEITTGTKTFNIPPCNQTSGCSLSEQIIDSTVGVLFTNLTSINITAEADDQPQAWWADDIQVAWSDRSCDAAVCRSQVPNAPSKRADAWSSTVLIARRLLHF